MLTAERPQQAEMSAWANSIYKQKYAHPGEEWPDTAKRVATHVLGALGYGPDSAEVQRITQLIADKKFIPGGRYLYASGRDLHQVNNCLLLRAEDSREGWADLTHRSMMALMTGAGIGINYSDVRPNGSVIEKTGGVASGPISLMHIINETGRHIMQGGSRRSAIWAGLSWSHPDIFDFIKVKDWDSDIIARKAEDFNYAASLDMTNVSILLDDDFFKAYETSGPVSINGTDVSPNGMSWNDWARMVYSMGVEHMVRTAEPGFSVDIGENAGEDLRNACCELTSHDDSDICNLGSINLAQIDSIEDMQEVVEYGTLFLLAGTVYSDLPYEQVEKVRAKNRRLGLGLMGAHEWLLKRGLKYEPSDELGALLDVYKTSTDAAWRYADLHNISRPVKTRAIAPTGTIAIVAETTTGCEPVFCTAFKRRYLVDGVTWKYQYVIDPTAERLIQNGVDPDSIEDAYSLSYNVEKRIAFQAWLQQYVDHAISSTINIPYPIVDKDEARDFADTLMQYLPRLRGITTYPDGARGGQPLTSVPYEIAASQLGVVFEESDERCRGGSCGA
jgi:ribonucleoside-diphosphate reductase alpha chain